ncbi:MAG: DNA translocase FtsK 4TM domain-containing protein, partial [Gemmatimonadaceae bacterium]|nr:DNA translocase FtsK 4TM domain-containing protein [Gemmatimonadaceae bacterium]
MSGLRKEIAGSIALLSAAFVGGALLLQRAASDNPCHATGPFGIVGTGVSCALVWTIGRPTALLGVFGIVLVALSWFGRLRAESSRSIGVLALGGVALVPVMLGLLRPRSNGLDQATGQWGAFVAYYLQQSLGQAGAWLVLLLATSVLTAVTLQWNPLRLLVGRPRGTSDAVTDDAPPARASRVTRAQALEPAPEEMPAIRAVADEREVDAIPAAVRDRRTARPKPPAPDPDIAEALAAPASAESDGDDLLPPTTLLDAP